MFKLDIKDFFGSIDEVAVYKSLVRIGIQNDFAFELARICTYKFNGDKFGFLPQGASTSGFLSNLVCFNMDQEIYKFCKKNGIRYTRYSDDMIFSVTYGSTREEIEKYLYHISGIVKKYRFDINKTKTRIIPPGVRKLVLGLLVDTNVRLTKEYKARIEHHLYAIEKFGLYKHMLHVGALDENSFIHHLQGLIYFAMGINKEWSAVMMQKLDLMCKAQEKGGI